MSDDEHDESMNTILLRAPAQQAPEPDPPPAARFVCLEAGLLDSVPADGAFPLTVAEGTIGRGEECTLRIESTEVSRVHARTSVYSDRWVIEDAGSSNGITVNGEPVSGKTVIVNGDAVSFGKVPFRFEVGDPPDDAGDDEVVLEVPEAAPAAAPEPDAEMEMILELPESLGGATPPPVPAADAPPEPATAATTPQAGPAAVAEADPFTVEAPGAPRTARARPLAFDPAGAGPADVAAVRAELPQLVGLLLAQARAGDATAARACLEFLIHEEQRLPESVAGATPIGQAVKKLLAAMTAGEIPPRQALDALQAIAAARDLLKKS